MKEIFRKIILVICVIVFLVSGYKIVKYYYDGYTVKKEFKKLEELFSYDLAGLKEKNSDTFGWLKVPNTSISYPMMFTPSSPEFYLHRNFDKEYSLAGTPFIDGYWDEKNSKHMIVYGHHMKDGTMFKDLINYKDPEYYKTHDTIEIDYVNGGKKKYKIFAFTETDALSEGFNVYNYSNIYDKSSFDAFVKGVKSTTPIDTGITPQYGDNIITLSTCAYHTDEGRYVVSAVEIKE